MADRPRIDLYCEDSGHEQFARALVNRLAADQSLHFDLRTPSGRGGHGRAVTELKIWQRTVFAQQGVGHSLPDLLVLMIDANCKGWAQVRRTLEEAVDSRIFSHCVIGCPDPHVEKWCLADPQAIQEVLGVTAPPVPEKCERHLYKQLLRQTIRDAGQPILTNEMEYAPDLVAAMDLYRAGKNQPSLRHFVDELRSALRSLL
jgi:uncharacterized protein DUF4276